MARPKGSKNKASLIKKAKAKASTPGEPRFDARSELIGLYKQIKPTPKNIDQRLEILRELKNWQA